MADTIVTDCDVTWFWLEYVWANPEDKLWDDGYEVEASLDGALTPALTMTTLGPRVTTPCLNVGNGVDLSVRVRGIDRDALGTITSYSPYSDWSHPVQFQYVPEPGVTLALLCIAVLAGLVGIVSSVAKFVVGARHDRAIRKWRHEHGWDEQRRRSRDAEE